MGVSQSKILEHITKLTTEVKELDIKKLKKDAVNIDVNITKITDLMQVLQLKLDKIIEQEPGEEVILKPKQELISNPEEELISNPEQKLISKSKGKPETEQRISKGGKKRIKTKKHKKKNRKKTGKK